MKMSEDYLTPIPKDFEKINEFIYKLSKSDLELLNNMDEKSNKYLFEGVKHEFQRRKKESKAERIRAIKFFFCEIIACAIATLFMVYEPQSNISILLLIFMYFAIFAPIISLFAIPINAIRSAIIKKDFELREHLQTNDLYSDGLFYFFSFIILVYIETIIN